MPVIPALEQREPKPETGRVISTRVPPELATRLEELSKETGHSVSAVVRFLMIRGLREHDAESTLAQRPNDDDAGKR